MKSLFISLCLIIVLFCGVSVVQADPCPPFIVQDAEGIWYGEADRQALYGLTALHAKIVAASAEEGSDKGAWFVYFKDNNLIEPAGMMVTNGGWLFENPTDQISIYGGFIDITNIGTFSDTIRGTIKPGKSLKGELAFSNNPDGSTFPAYMKFPMKFDLSYYDSLTVASFAGTYTGLISTVFFPAIPATIVVNTDGTFSCTPACSVSIAGADTTVSGTLTARSRGTIFDVVLDQQGQGEYLKGVAFHDISDKRLIIAARSVGFNPVIFSGVKQ